MNFKTVIVIFIMGALGAFAFIVIAMMGFKKLSDQPMVRARVEVANRFQVREVTVQANPKDATSRTLQVGYETSVSHASLDNQTAEMEGIAKFAWDQTVQAEQLEISSMRDQVKRQELIARPPIKLVTVRRIWRSDRGCFKRSDEATHEWTPPPPPPGRR